MLTNFHSQGSFSTHLVFQKWASVILDLKHAKEVAVAKALVSFKRVFEAFGVCVCCVWRVVVVVVVVVEY